MGLINSDPLNVLVIFLKKGLVRKGVEWLCHQLFFPISIILPALTSVLQQPSPSAPCPRTAPEHHSPRSSPLTVVYGKFSQAEVAAPMLTMLSFFLSIHSCVPFTDTCCSPSAAAFWARRGCAGVCLLSTKPCRTCSTTTGAARPNEVQQQRSLLVSFNERVISVDIGWSKCQYHSIILILQHLFHIALTW